MPPKKEFYCDCRQYCRSQRRQVSRTTYYNHAHYRNLPLLQALRLALGASDSAEPTGIQSTHTRSTKRHRTQRRGQQRVAGSSSSAGTHAGADLQGASGNAELEPPGSQPVQADPRESIPQPPVGTEHSSVEEPESGTHGAAGSLPKPTSEEPKHATAVIERMRHPRRHGDLPDLTPPERSQQRNHESSSSRSQLRSGSPTRSRSRSHSRSQSVYPRTRSRDPYASRSHSHMTPYSSCIPLPTTSHLWYDYGPPRIAQPWEYLLPPNIPLPYPPSQQFSSSLDYRTHYPTLSPTYGTWTSAPDPGGPHATVAFIELAVRLQRVEQELPELRRQLAELQYRLNNLK